MRKTIFMQADRRTSRTRPGRHLGFDRLEPRLLLAADTTGALTEFGSRMAAQVSDVNRDGEVSAADALAVINHLSREPQYDARYDVNLDDRVSALDVLMIINRLARNDAPPIAINPLGGDVAVVSLDTTIEAAATSGDLVLLRIPEIRGTSTLAGYKDWIEVDQISLGVSRPASNGTTGGQSQTFLSELAVNAPLDASSLRVWQAAATGRALPEVDVVILSQFESELLPVLEYTLGDATVTSHHFDSESGQTPLSTRFAIHYAGITDRFTDLSILPAPRVENVLINDGADQRSSLTDVRVVFDRAVEIDFDAGNPFEIRHLATDQSPTLVPHVSQLGHNTVVDLSFGPGPSVTAGGSLADGAYELRISSDLISSQGVSLDGNSNGLFEVGGDHIFGQEAADHFFRLYGDQNGSGTVELLDFAAFRRTFGRSAGEAGYVGSLDADGSDTIDLIDFAGFRRNFGKSV